MNEIEWDEEWDDDSPNPTPHSTLESTYVNFLCDTPALALPMEFIQVLQDKGIYSFTTLEAFLCRPVEQMVAIMGMQDLFQHRTSVLRIMLLGMHFSETTAYRTQPFSALQFNFDPSLYFLASAAHKASVIQAINHAVLSLQRHPSRTQDNDAAPDCHSVTSATRTSHALPTVSPTSPSPTLPIHTTPDASTTYSPPVAPGSFLSARYSQTPKTTPSQARGPPRNASLAAPSPPKAEYDPYENAFYDPIEEIERTLRTPHPRSRLSLPSVPKVIPRPAFNGKTRWNGLRETFPTFKSAFEGHLIMAQCGYAIAEPFMRAYSTARSTCLSTVSPHLMITQAQLRSDSSYIFGALMMACSATAQGDRVLDRHRAEQDGILAWSECLGMYMLDGTKRLQIATHEDTLQTKYYRHYPKGIVGFVDDYRAAYNGLYKLGKVYSDLDMRDRLLNNLWTPDMSLVVDHCAENNLDFLATCNYIQDRGVRIDAYEAKESITRANQTNCHPPPDPGCPPNPTRQALLTLLSHGTSDPDPMVHFILITVRRGLPDGYGLHTKFWRALSPETRAELTRIRQELLSSGMAPSTKMAHSTSTPLSSTDDPSLSSLAPTPSPITPLTPTVDPSSSSSSLPKQYTQPRGDRSIQLTQLDSSLDLPDPSLDNSSLLEEADEQTNMDEPVDDTRLVAMLTSALQHENHLFGTNRYTYMHCTVSPSGPPIAGAFLRMLPLATIYVFLTMGLIPASLATVGTLTPTPVVVPTLLGLMPSPLRNLAFLLSWRLPLWRFMVTPTSFAYMKPCITVGVLHCSSRNFNSGNKAALLIPFPVPIRWILTAAMAPNNALCPTPPLPSLSWLMLAS